MTWSFMLRTNPQTSIKPSFKELNQKSGRPPHDSLGQFWVPKPKSDDNTQKNS